MTTIDDAKKFILEEVRATGRLTSLALRYYAESGLPFDDLEQLADQGRIEFRRANDLCEFCGAFKAAYVAICDGCGRKWSKLSGLILLIVPSLTLGLGGSIPPGPLFC